MFTTAPEIARLADASEVKTTHILIAMLFEQVGIAGCVLRDRQLDVALVEDAMSVCVKPDATFCECESAAIAAAEWLGNLYAGTEHLLLGLCNLHHSHAYIVLENVGVSPVVCCRDVLELLGRGDDWERWHRDHPVRI